MKILTALSFFLFLSFPFNAIADGTVLPFVAYWSVGDTYDFKVTKIKRKWLNGRLTEHDSVSYISQFKVLDSTDTGYRISWTYKEGDGHKILPSFMKEKSPQFQLSEVIYKTDALGSFLEIENLDSITSAFRSLFTKFITTNKNPSIEKIIRATLPIYTYQEGIELKIFNELHLIHFPFGLSYSVTKPIYYDDVLPNLAGGNPIRAKGKIYFERVDFDRNFCSMIQELTVNEKDAANVVNQALQALNLDSKAVKKAYKTSKIDFRESNRFDYFYKPGVPARIEYKRTGKIVLAEEKNEILEITRIELQD